MDWKCLVDKDTQTLFFISFFIMSVELMIGALRRGQTGNEILAILDAIAGGDSNTPEDVSPQPTFEIVEF